MPPRGRPRKRGMRRMDAALDAMRAFGFPENLIVKTIKELLNVYGEDGWPFIEEGSYKVLLDTILEEVEKEEEKKKDDASQVDGRSGDDTNTSVAETLSRGVLACSSVKDLQATDIASRTNEVSNAELNTNEAVDTAGRTNETGDRSCWKDNNLDSRRKQMNIVTGTHDGNSGGLEHLVNISCSPPNGICFQQPLHSIRTQKREPYHGWIRSEDEEEDLVQLKPEPLSQELARLLIGNDVRRKRKSMWDVKPEDT